MNPGKAISSIKELNLYVLSDTYELLEKWKSKCGKVRHLHNKVVVKKISKIIIDEMSSVTDSDLHSFSIPLTVDLNTGDNWGALH